MVAAQQYTPEQVAAIRVNAQVELCRVSFLDALRFIQVVSDNPGHIGAIPWERWEYLLLQAEALAQGDSEFILKDRQLGYSWLVAAYAWFVARKGGLVALISKDQFAARELLSKCKFIELHLPEHLRTPGDFLVDYMNYEDGGRIIAFPSTPDAGVSFMFHLIIMDEAAFHPYAKDNYGALLPAISAGGQFVALSTADPKLGPSGWFHDNYWASQRGQTGYRARFVPWYVRPGRDQAWLESERRKYQGDINAFSAFYANTDEEAFVGRSGLVYPQFSYERHVRPHPCAWAEYKLRIAGVDFGGGDPTAIIPLGVTYKEHVHQPTEWFHTRGAPTTDLIANRLFKLHNIAPFMSIECDPSQPIIIRDLQALGLPARAANNKRGEGLGAVRWLLDNDRFSVAPTCSNSIEEYGNYRWAEATDPSDHTRYATSTPGKTHGDGHDARRYAAMRLLPLLRTQQVQEQGVFVEL